MRGRVKETFPIDWSREEFAARDGCGRLGFSFGRYRYRDDKLDKWIQAVIEMPHFPDKLQDCQAKYLTSAERRLIDKYM